MTGRSECHVDDAVVADAEIGAKLFKSGELTPAGGNTNDGVHFTGSFVVTEPRAENVIRRHDTLECRLDDLLRRGGDDVEMELVAPGARLSKARAKSATSCFK